MKRSWFSLLPRCAGSWEAGNRRSRSARDSCTFSVKTLYPGLKALPSTKSHLRFCRRRRLWLFNSSRIWRSSSRKRDRESLIVTIASVADSWALSTAPQALSRCRPRSDFSRAERGMKGSALGFKELLDTDQLECDEGSEFQEGIEDAVEGLGGGDRNSAGVWNSERLELSESSE